MIFSIITKIPALKYCFGFTVFVGPDEPFIYSHPKLEKLEEVVLQHFRLWAESSANNNGDLLNIALLCCGFKQKCDILF